MLPALRQAAPSVLRQCRSSAVSTIHHAQSARALASSSVLRDTVTKPSWVRTTDNAPNRWTYLMGVVAKATKGSRKQVSPEETWANKETTDVQYLPPPNNAYSGRSVPVNPEAVGLALTKLKGILTVNAVRQTAMRDERHEKKGEKRNRLKSLRWRRRFAHEVRKKVQLVNEIRARGA